MSRFNVDHNITAPDDLYEQLIAMHDGLSDEESMKLNAKIILLLVNHIGDPEVIAEAIGVATRKIG